MKFKVGDKVILKVEGPSYGLGTIHQVHSGDKWPYSVNWKLASGAYLGNWCREEELDFTEEHYTKELLKKELGIK